MDSSQSFIWRALGGSPSQEFPSAPASCSVSHRGLSSAGTGRGLVSTGLGLGLNFVPDFSMITREALIMFPFLVTGPQLSLLRSRSQTGDLGSIWPASVSPHRTYSLFL